MFLATTALSEFWEKDREILFLGSWCLRQDHRSEWERLAFQVMPSPWNDRSRHHETARYLDEYGERVLTWLTDYLNGVHDVGLPPRYWRILVGPWLISMLHATYDRYVHLAEAFRHYPNLGTIALAPSSFRAPQDSVEVMEWICNDPYNLQLISQLLQGMGYSFPARELPGWSTVKRPAAIACPGRWSGLLNQAIRQGLNLIEEAIGKLRRSDWQVALCELELPRSLMWKFMRQSGFRSLPLRISRGWSFSVPKTVMDGRREGLASLPSTSEFESIFSKLLPQNFPPLYLEGYERAKAEISRRHTKIPPVLVSATGWSANEPFKFLAAESLAKGKRLISVQHGGGYGIYRYAPYELHESRIGDRFLVWGWGCNNGDTYRNVPVPKLSEFAMRKEKNRRVRSSRGVVLFLATGHRTYLLRFHSAPLGSQWQDYYQWEVRFLAAVSDRVRRAILFRASLNPAHANLQALAERFPKMQLDEGCPFYERLKQAHLIVVDNCQTAFLEALAANIPTVIFRDPHRWEVREEAAPYFEALREAGILWDSPESAAAKVSDVYDDPLAWWSSQPVQEARGRFVNRYAFVREDWPACWTQVLREEARVAATSGQTQPA